jgi:formiminotetrahydrofolate cyclodeaminase
MKLAERALIDLLAAFRSSAPTPGGGSAAALAGALGASLLAMVGSMPRHRGASEEDVERLRAAASRCGGLADRLTELIDLDSAAYDRVMAAYMLSRASDVEKAERNASIQEALGGAIEVPLEVMRRCAEGIEAAAVIARFGSPNAGSDTGVALELLLAAGRGARLNVEINLDGIKDPARAERVRADAAVLDAECVAGAEAARTALSG